MLKCPPLFTERSAVNRGGVPMGRRGSGKVKRSELSVEGYLPLNAPPSTEQPPRRVAPLPLLASLRFANRGRHPVGFFAGVAGRFCVFGWCFQSPRHSVPLPLLASLRFANRGRHPLYRCASKHCCQLIAIR